MYLGGYSLDQKKGSIAALNALRHLKANSRATQK